MWVTTTSPIILCSSVDANAALHFLQIVESCNPGLENMEKVWRTWRTWKRWKTSTMCGDSPMQNIKRDVEPCCPGIHRKLHCSQLQLYRIVTLCNCRYIS